MISRQVPVHYSLTCALLAILFSGCCAPAGAAPMGESNTAAQGSAATATLEVSKFGYDLANTIPIGFSTTNTQPYISTEIDTEATVALTSLSMTNEEMALAEVAAVVAELATSAAAELKVRDDDEVVEKEQISRKAEEDRQKVIAGELDNAVEAMEGVTINAGDFIPATTFRKNLPRQIDTTPITTTISPAIAQPVIPSTATESPAILDELVRAAVAANEILAAALNVATMAVTNVNTTTAATTTDDANLATTLQPEVASNTTAVSHHELVSDREMLPEHTESYALQANEIERLPTTTEVTNAIPDYSTTLLPVEMEPTDNAIEVSYNKLLARKELDNIRQIQTATPRGVQETITESIGKSTVVETTDLLKIDGLTNTDEEPMRTLTSTGNKVSESIIIEEKRKSQETMTSIPPGNNTNLEISSLDAENVVTNTTDNVATQIVPAVESANENETEHTVQTTTNESLETLIAVESEAMVPSKIVLISEEEVLQETTTTIPEVTAIISESVLSTNEDRTTTEASSDENLSTETATVAATLFFTTIGSQEENISTTESLDVKTDSPSVSEREKLVEDIEKITESPSPTGTSNTITEISDEKQTVSTTSMSPEKEAATIFEEELSTSPLSVSKKYKEMAKYSTADIEISTTSIEEPITVTRIPLTVNTPTQSAEPIHETISELSQLSTDAPPLSTITKLTTEELPHLESSANQVNFEAFPNTDPTDVLPQSTTKPAEDIITTTLSTSPETTTTTATTTASATEMPEIDNTISDSPNIGSTTEIWEQLPTTTEVELSNTMTITEKRVESEDAAEPKVTTTTEQLFHTSTEKDHQEQQQQRVISTTNAIVTTEESTIEDADVTTSTTTADITTTATAVNTPEVEVTTTVSTTSSEPDITTTTTTTTLSPMSLIVAEHEARSLDRTPPRVSRIVNEDGVEVLTGYSIVHHMHAAALAALAAEGA